MNNFRMHYAERLGDGETEPYIAERGIFYSVEEFVPFRKKGWSGTDEFNAEADAVIEKEKDN